MALTRVNEYQVNTQATGIDDPIVTVNELQTGANATDIGFVLNRGASGNVAFIWNEVNKIFRLLFTSSSGKEATTAITNTGNAPLLTGSQFVSNGNFSVEGDAQAATYVVRGITTNATQTELFLDGASTKIVIPNNSAVTYSVQIAARRTDATGDYGAWELNGLIIRDTGPSTTLLAGNLSKSTLATVAGWGVDAYADTTNGALSIKVTGAASQTIRWVATVKTTTVVG